ncbi:MAG: winged helix DNA-binding domain-containing protein [Aristaeellaceae bacterium]
MTTDEIRLLRLQGQHLLAPAPSLTVARDLCGLQAQILSCALHALRIRSGDANPAGLAKSWTLRGTMHLFPEADLPLYIRRQGTPEDVCDTPWYRWSCTKGEPGATPERERFFARLVTEQIAAGHATREELRQRCREAGMTEKEETHVFHSWGGVVAELAQLGVICLTVREEKSYRLCPPFTPLAEEDAETELARRYFTHYGPATLRDAAYFFHVPQEKVKQWLARLPAEALTAGGQTFYRLPCPAPEADMPRCLLLAGFDQLMLGYRKEDNPFLSPEHLRGIFSLAGLVFPAILLDGRVVGKWKQRDGQLSLTLFEPVDQAGRQHILSAAEALWPIRQADWL